MTNATAAWPELELAGWKDTYESLHLWTQIVGKIRLANTPWLNHSWHVPLYLSARGLTTSRMLTRDAACEIEFDFIDHRLVLTSSDGREIRVPLKARPVSEFFREVVGAAGELGLSTAFYPVPNELPDPIPFEQDERHDAYDPAAAHRFWQALVRIEKVFETFRARFIGKCSPVHFFWGSFDVAVTRFSGRTAPPHPGGVPHLPDAVAREAYSHEVSSAGFWPGGDPAPYPLFYSYGYPEPRGFAAAAVEPAEAFYSPELREFVLPYEAVRGSSDPDGTLLAFLESTYRVAADLGRWDRDALERPPGWRLE